MAVRHSHTNPAGGQQDVGCVCVCSSARSGNLQSVLVGMSDMPEVDEHRSTIMQRERCVQVRTSGMMHHGTSKRLANRRGVCCGSRESLPLRGAHRTVRFPRGRRSDLVPLLLHDALPFDRDSRGFHAGATQVTNVRSVLAANSSSDGTSWLLLTREGLQHVPVSGAVALLPPAARSAQPPPAQQKPKAGEDR